MPKRIPKTFEKNYDNIVMLTHDKTAKRNGQTVIVRPKTYLAPLSNEFENCYKECVKTLVPVAKISLTSKVPGKTYFAYQNAGKRSRPVNEDLYNDAASVIGTDGSGKNITKVDQFFANLKAKNIAAQSADDITSALYKIVMDFACCTDLFSSSGVKQVGTYFEKLVGHLYATHFNIEPELTLSTIPLDGKSEPIPADFIFNTGIGKGKFHVPAKFSSRDRVVQVWAQQRLIDGAYGTNRFFCLLTCCNETDLNNGKVVEICVPGQWINYQLYISEILRAYYLDPPTPYLDLASSYPPIHVKKFGEFFHESATLI